ncbi:hypothetical protein YC2023_033384 [Brassica napus]
MVSGAFRSGVMGDSARPWGPHDFLAVLFGAKKCVEVNGVKKASKTPSESAFDLFYSPPIVDSAAFRNGAMGDSRPVRPLYRPSQPRPKACQPVPRSRSGTRLKSLKINAAENKNKRVNGYP